jgi:hypothetical protein
MPRCDQQANLAHALDTLVLIASKISASAHRELRYEACANVFQHRRHERPCLQQAHMVAAIILPRSYSNETFIRAQPVLAQPPQQAFDVVRLIAAVDAAHGHMQCSHYLHCPAPQGPPAAPAELTCGELQRVRRLLKLIQASLERRASKQLEL